MRVFWRFVFIVLIFFAGLVVIACGDDDEAADDDEASVECEENICTDPVSGLTWQKAPPSKYLSWEEAITYCEELSVAGGGWHLPTISELRSLIRGCDATGTGGSCGVAVSC